VGVIRKNVLDYALVWGPPLRRRFWFSRRVPLNRAAYLAEFVEACERTGLVRYVNDAMAVPLVADEAWLDDIAGGEEVDKNAWRTRSGPGRIHRR
jgi:hypothetical protein